jgi:hypothetical protein
MDKWISIEDRLPEYQQQWDGKTFVVALFEPNNYDQWAGRVQSMTSTFLLNYLEAKIVVQSSGVITHWMPLPNAPP